MKRSTHELSRAIVMATMRSAPPSSSASRSSSIVVRSFSLTTQISYINTNPPKCEITYLYTPKCQITYINTGQSSTVTASATANSRSSSSGSWLSRLTSALWLSNASTPRQQPPTSSGSNVAIRSLKTEISYMNTNPPKCEITYLYPQKCEITYINTRHSSTSSYPPPPGDSITATTTTTITSAPTSTTSPSSSDNSNSSDSSSTITYMEKPAESFVMPSKAPACEISYMAKPAEKVSVGTTAEDGVATSCDIGYLPRPAENVSESISYLAKGAEKVLTTGAGTGRKGPSCEISYMPQPAVTVLAAGSDPVPACEIKYMARPAQAVSLDYTAEASVSSQGAAASAAGTGYDGLLTQQVTRLDARVAELTTESTVMSRQTAWLDTRIDRLNAEVGAIKDQVKGDVHTSAVHSAQIKELLSRVEKLQADSDALNKSSLDLQRRVSRLQPRVLDWLLTSVIAVWGAVCYRNGYFPNILLPEFALPFL